MQLSVMRSRASYRLNEAGTPVFYPAAEIISALNEAQRFFCLLTLALEETATWTVSTTFTHMLTVFSDWIAPLRLLNPDGSAIRPATLADMNAIDPWWISSAGAAAQRYVALGADLIGLHPQVGATLTVIYARAPVALVNDTDVPEIPAEYHPELVKYAIYRLRQVEGSLKGFNDFLDAAQKYGDYVRERNKGTDYDTGPFELKSFDRSKLQPEADQ